MGKTLIDLDEIIGQPTQWTVLAARCHRPGPARESRRRHRSGRRRAGGGSAAGRRRPPGHGLRATPSGVGGKLGRYDRRTPTASSGSTRGRASSRSRRSSRTSSPRRDPLWSASSIWFHSIPWYGTFSRTAPCLDSCSDQPRVRPPDRGCVRRPCGGRLAAAVAAGWPGLSDILAPCASLQCGLSAVVGEAGLADRRPRRHRAGPDATRARPVVPLGPSPADDA